MEIAETQELPPKQEDSHSETWFSENESLSSSNHNPEENVQSHFSFDNFEVPETQPDYVSCAFHAIHREAIKNRLILSESS